MFRSSFPILRTMYMRFTVFSDLSILLFCFTNFGFYEISTPVIRPMLTMPKKNLQQHFQHSLNCVNQIFSVFKSFVIAVCFGTFWFLRNFYSGDAHHVNYGESCSIHHFRHCANWLYKIYRILKLSQIAVCFAHFDFFEISTRVMPTIPTIGNFI